MPQRRPPFVLAATCVALAALLAASGDAWAQNGAITGAKESPAEQVGPVSIPVASIAAQASALDGFLRSVEASLAPPESQQAIADALHDVEDDVRARSKRLEQKIEYGYDRGDLDAMKASWRSIQGDLERWESVLGTRLSNLEQHRKELDERTQVWDLTARDAKEEAVPAEVRGEIASAQTKLGKAQRELRKSRDAALGLQRSVVTLQSRVDAQLDAITLARDEVLRHVVRQNDSPLWQIEIGDYEENRENFGVAVAEARSALEDYTARSGSLLVLHTLLIVALMLACARARRSVLKSDPDAARPMPAALNHPLAAGFLLGVTLTIWLHTDAPPKFGQLLTIFALPFWFLVLRSVVPPALRVPLVGLLVIEPFEILRQLLLDFDLVSRGLLTGEAALIFAGVLWLRRPARIGAVPRTGSLFWVRVLAFWTHAALFGSGVALVGSLLGFTTISDLLLTTLASGTFIGSVLFAATRVVEGIAEGMTLSGQLRRIRLIHNNPRAFLRVVERVGRSIAFATWIYRILDGLSIQNALAGSVESILAQRLGYGNVQVDLGGVLAFGVALWVSWLLSRFVAALLEQEIFTRVGLPRGVPFALSTISRYVVLVLGFVTAIAALGVEVGNLALLVSALGVGIGFGMQNIVNNFVSGLILLFERPIKVGDRVSIAPIMGEVTRIGIRASSIRTFDGADVIVPNGDLISNQVVNWTLADTRRRVDIPVGVAYGTPARDVIELLAGVAAADEAIMQDPAPVALFVGFGDSSLDFELRAWTESVDAVTLVRSGLAVAIQEALASANIEVPFPQRDLHVKTANPREDPRES